jgi:GAF domain-containing protein/HAMP domain-containing protein
MQTKKEQKTNISDIQTQRAFWISIGTGVVMLIVMAIFLVTDSGRELVGPKDVRVFVAALAVCGFISAWLSRQGRVIAGITLIMVVFYISVALTALSLADVGVAIATVTVVFTFGITSAVIPSTRLEKYANVFAIIVAAGIVLLDVFKPFERAPNDTPEVTWGLAMFLVLVYGVLAFRQIGAYSLRAKLVIAFLAVTIIPLAFLAFLNDRNSRQALTDDANTALFSAASTTAAQLDAFTKQNLDFVRAEAQLPAIVEYLSLPATQRAGSEQEGRALKFITALNHQNPVYIDSIGVYDLQGNTLLDTFSDDIGVNKTDRSWFQKPLGTGLPYASDLEFSQSTGAASIYFSGLVRDESGKSIGVFRVRYLAAVLQDIISANNNLLGQNSFAVLVDSETHIRLAHGTTPALVFKTVIPLDAATVKDLQARRLLPPGSPEKLSTNLPGFETALNNYQTQPFFSTYLAAASVDNILIQGAIAPMETQAWTVAYVQDQAAFVAPINAQARANVVLTLVIAVLVAGFAVFMAQTLSGPIARLTQVAETIAGGNVNIQAKVESQDEIGKLAGAFNRMTGQLREFIGTLESRVAERTRNLELAAEVGRTVSQVRALDVMLKEAVDLIRKQFDLYYAQVYLVNPSQTALVLKAGTGNVGVELLKRSHQLTLNASSLNGRAAVEKKPVVISDTAESATFKPNPLLPYTRSEMAVPLLVGERVVGVLDMQSEHPGALKEEALSAFEAMAGQLAIAIQNATLLEEAQRARAEVEAQARRLTRANWVDYLDAIHQPEETGFVFEQNTISPLSHAEKTQTAGNALVAPISVTGESLGNLIVEMEGGSPIARTDELVNAIARQVAEHIESLRLLDTAERYRAEAEEASRRVTREGWKDYMETKTGDSLSYIYDLTKVKEHDREALQSEDSGVTLPLKIRDETIGNLSIHGVKPDDSESIELANAVAERLSAHIENLRLSQQTLERAQREQILRQITSAVRGSTDPETIIRTAVRELGGIFGRKTMIQIKTVKKEAPSDSGSGTQPSTVTDQTLEA